MIDSPATSTSISPPKDIGGSAVAEVPNLLGATPSKMNADSRYNEIGAVRPCAIDGPAEVYTPPVHIRPTVDGPGSSPWDTPAGSTTQKGGR